MTRLLTPFGFTSTAADVLADVHLSGRRAIVTGATSGIGVETAHALAAAGAAGLRAQTATAVPQTPQTSNCRRFHRATGTKNNVNCLNSRIRVHCEVL